MSKGPDLTAELEDAVASLRTLPAAVRGAELDALCAAHPAAATSLRALAMLQDFAGEPPVTHAHIGPYEIIEKLGEGGMGIVYSARREGDDRLVALKVLRVGAAGDELTARFRREGHLLEQLRHPGIAALVASDEATVRQADGRVDLVPYMALELIDGDPLLLAARAPELSDRHRIELLLRICEAVAHAHEHGFVHRDLKPANILVCTDGDDPVPRPKILDFGIARIVDTEWHRSATLTGKSDLLGTLPYMSPEQITAGRTVDKTSDVYSLGVVMFEVLARRLPYEVRGRPLPEAARIITEEIPLRLGAVAPEWAGAVETIVGRALEKAPRSRYPSATELADDLRRYLAGAPIKARPPSLVRRTLAVIRRNRVAFGMITALSAGLVTSSWFAIREASARADATASAELADARAGRAHLAAAAVEIQQHDVVSAARHLAAVQEARRGWTWRHLDARTDASYRAEAIASGQAGGSIAFARDGGSLRVEERVGGVTRLYGFALDGGENGPTRSIESEKAVLDPTGAVLCRLVESGELRVGPIGGEERSVALPGTGRERLFATSDGGRRVLLVRGGEVHRIDVAAGTDARLPGRDLPQQLIHPFLEPGGTWGGCVARGLILVWRLDGGAPPQRIACDPRLRIRAVGTDTRGQFLAAGTERDARIYRIEAGGAPRLHLRIPSTDGDIRALAFSPDGERVAIGGDDHCVRIHACATGALLRVLVGHSGAVTELAFSPDGKALASMGTDARVRLWRVGSDDPSVLRHGGYVYAAGFSRDGSTLYTGAWDGLVRVFDTASGRQLAALQTGGEATFLTDLAVHPRRDVVAVVERGPEGSRVAVLDVAEGREVASLPADGAAGKPGSLVFALDGRFLVMSSSGEVLETCETAGFSVVARRHLPVADPRPQRTRALAAAGERLAVSCGDSVELLDVATLRSVAAVGLGAQVSTLAFDPTGRELAVGLETGAIRQYDTVTGATRALRTHSHTVHALVYTPDGQRLVSASHDRTIRIWDVASGELVAVLRGHSNYVYALALDPEGEALVSASGDGTARIWDTRSASRWWHEAARFDDAHRRLSAEFGGLDRGRRDAWLRGLAPRDRHIAHGLLLGQSPLAR